MKYFRINYGYDETQYVSITEEELPKAILIFLTANGRGLFGGEAIRGKDIISIRPDWHRERGWNQGWEMTPDDYEDVKPLERGYRDTFFQAKEIVRTLIESGQTKLCERPLSELMQKFGRVEQPKEISEGAKALSDKFKIS